MSVLIGGMVSGGRAFESKILGVGVDVLSSIGLMMSRVVY